MIPFPLNSLKASCFDENKFFPNVINKVEAFNVKIIIYRYELISILPFYDLLATSHVLLPVS